MVTIHLSKADIEKITKWNKNNAEKRANTSGYFPYKQFRIEAEDDECGIYTYDVVFHNNNVNLGICMYTCRNETMPITIGGSYGEIEEKMIKQGKAKSINDYVYHYSAVTLFFISVIAYIQHKMSRRKTVLIESDKTMNKSNKAKTRLNKTSKPREVFLLDDFVQYEHKEPTGIKHNITCPTWEVKGHERHCKSGKVVWVKGFKKGKERDSAKTKDVNVFLSK